MKNTAVLICVTFLFVFIFATPLFAEKIVLKSEKVLEGRIVERPDDIPDNMIIVEWEGSRLTLGLDQIKSIDGRAPEVPAWSIWYDSVERYVLGVDDILTEENALLKQFSDALVGETFGGNQIGVEIISSIGKLKLTDRTAKLEAMRLPEELKIYHQKAIAISKNNEAILNALKTSGLEGASAYIGMAAKLTEEWGQEIIRVYVEHGIPENALGTQKKFVELHQKSIENGENIDAYCESIKSASQGDFTQAADAFRTVINNTDSSSLKQSSKQWLSVIEDLERGKLEQTVAASLFRTQVYLNEMKLDEARSEVQKAITAAPDYYYGYALLSDVLYLADGFKYLRAGDMGIDTPVYKDAVENLEKALNLNPTYIEGYIRLAFFSYKTGMRENAEKFLHKAAELLRAAGDEKEAENIERSIGGQSIGSAGITDAPEYFFYAPDNVDTSGKAMLVIALSPNADANSMIDLWRPIADKYKFLIYASKVSKNGPPVVPTLAKIREDVISLSKEHPFDFNKIVAAGMSGGGMSAHFFSYFHSDLISAVIVNTGMIHPSYKESQIYPKGKLAVFLASPTDYRYGEMRLDKRFLDSRGWKTKWIEFQGGHIVAPPDKYDEAIRWVENNLG